MRYLILSWLVLCVTASFSQEKEKGYILKSIYFGGGSSYVDEIQIAELNHLIDSIPNIKDYTITVHSHTDNIGGAAYNKRLSQRRSEAVIQELLLSEFSINQIEIKDFGMYNPVFDNSTWEGRNNNRRVDIIFWPIVM